MPEEDKDPNFKEKVNETLSKLSSNDYVKKGLDLTKNNVGETVACIILLIGLIVSSFNSFWGGAIVGLVAGIYFSKEIEDFLFNFQGFMRKYGVIKTVTLCALLIVFFIAYPLLFIVGGIMVVLIQVLSSSQKKGDP